MELTPITKPSAQEIKLRPRGLGFRKPKESTPSMIERVKNSLEINAGLTDLYNTIKAGTMAMFFGPQIYNYLHQLNQHNGMAFNWVYNAFLANKDAKEAQQIIHINEEQERNNRRLIEQALIEKSALEKAIAIAK